MFPSWLSRTLPKMVSWTVQAGAGASPKATLPASSSSPQACQRRIPSRLAGEAAAVPAAHCRSPRLSSQGRDEREGGTGGVVLHRARYTRCCCCCIRGGLLLFFILPREGGRESDGELQTGPQLRSQMRREPYSGWPLRPEACAQLTHTHIQHNRPTLSPSARTRLWNVRTVLLHRQSPRSVQFALVLVTTFSFFLVH